MEVFTRLVADLRLGGCRGRARLPVSEQHNRLVDADHITAVTTFHHGPNVR